VLLGLAAAIAIVVIGYRMGSETGLAVMAGGVLVAWFIGHQLTWGISTIDDVLDRPDEEGINHLVPRDLRDHDPDIVQSQRFWGTLDTPSGRRPHPDDPGRPH
jgi:hypothetical protein